ncbi:MAG: phosphomannomutase/phosphoglucomutase, partial [Abditibacteriota bacterium]|nr:phosphomannomutase/phosphoglucomutase [Abditibacteriota bacterium]
MNNIKRSIFKAYDIRGLVPEDFDAGAAYHIARAFVSIAGCKTCVIAHDMRLTGEELADALVRGCIDQGCDVYDIGLSSTPLYYYSVNRLAAEGGIMVTASHNPKEYNGMKIVLKGAVPAVGVIDNDVLWRCADESAYGEPAGKGKKLPVDADLTGGYADLVLKTAGLHDIKELKLAIDCGNGMGALTLEPLMSRLKNEPERLYWRPDGSFPNHPANPLNEDTLLQLKETVVDKKCDLGIAFDGDADRVGFVDEKGNVVPGDFIT